MDNPDLRLDILRGAVKESDESTVTKDDLKDDKKEQVWEKTIQFQCSNCGLCEMCHYFGTSPPFVKKSLEFSEECYVMLDPFSPYNLKTANNSNLISFGDWSCPRFENPQRKPNACNGY